MSDDLTEMKKKPIYDGKYFEILTINGSNANVKCNLCCKKYSTAINSTTNLKRHITKQHEPNLDEFLHHTVQKKKRKLDESQSGQSDNLTIKFVELGKQNSSQEECHDAVVRYIIMRWQPLLLVEDSEFRLMLKTFNRQYQPMCRATLVNRIAENYDEISNKLKIILQSVNYACTTADIWSANGKSLIGMTVHWLDANLQFKSAAIAVERFTGSHTHLAIAKKITAIHKKYGLFASKITKTVTDNARNFAKAFTLFEKEEELIYEEEDKITTVSIDDVFESTANDNFDSDDEEELLPKHSRCTAHCHRLNLIATVDAKLALKANVYKRRFNSAASKFQAICNAINRRVQVAEKIHQLCNRLIPTPGITSWNSYYDGIAVLLTLEQSLTDICEIANVPTFTTQDLEFWKSWKNVMHPIAFALDRMRSNEAHLGMLLPTLIGIERKMNHFKTSVNSNDPIIHLIDAILVGLKKRYGQVMDYMDENEQIKPTCWEQILASCTSPKYKLLWETNSLKKLKCKELLQNEMRKNKIPGHTIELEPPSTFEDCLDYFSTISQHRNGNNVEDELNAYLNCNSTEISSLLKFPTVANLFRKYNTTIASSAPVERLFSAASLIAIPTRNNLSDVNFENLILARINLGLTYDCD